MTDLHFFQLGVVMCRICCFLCVRWVAPAVWYHLHIYDSVPHTLAVIYVFVCAVLSF